MPSRAGKDKWATLYYFVLCGCKEIFAPCEILPPNYDHLPVWPNWISRKKFRGAESAWKLAELVEHTIWHTLFIGCVDSSTLNDTITTKRRYEVCLFYSLNTFLDAFERGLLWRSSLPSSPIGPTCKVRCTCRYRYKVIVLYDCFLSWYKGIRPRCLST